MKPTSIESPNDVEDDPKSPFSQVSASDEATSVERGPVQVLPFEEQGMDEAMTIQTHATNSKNSWLPWKRPNRRDAQLRHLREGYIELLGLVRSISDHLDRQKDEESQVTTLVESLPPALSSFEKLASSQREVTAILGNLNSHMEKTSEKDEKLLENLSGFNSTLQDVSSSHEKSLGTLGKVSERIENSDEQMKTLFEQANRSNEAAGSLMVRLEKRVFLSNMALVVLLSLILLFAMIWITKRPDLSPVAASPPPATTTVVYPPVAQQNPPAQQNPVVQDPVSVSMTSEVAQEIVPEVSPTENAAEDPVISSSTPPTAIPVGQEEPKEIEVPAGIEASEVDEIIEELDLFDYS